MPTESRITSNRRNNGGAELAHTALVFQTDVATDIESSCHTNDQNNTTATMGIEQGTSSVQQSDAACLSDIWETHKAQGISAAAANIIVSSWRSSSGKS